jgi:transcriptional regulator with XRE-family HTH domain
MAKHNFSVAQVIMGRRLEELRCARGMSVLEFVHKGWTRDPAIARIERGEMNPNLEFIARACGVLRAHPASLFTSCEFPFGSEFTRDELVAHVAGRVEIFRLMRHIAKPDLSRRASLNPEFVRKMQTGLAGGRLASVARIADVLDVPVWLLFV